ncbi:hypothetical protein A7K94_0212420 [Modestobacter sp. VKM Ac-2676]|nr:hypothetical protein A7K94_0212420 [Modestobacter sp. VKM Ac-2676]
MNPPAVVHYRRDAGRPTPTAAHPPAASRAGWSCCSPRGLSLLVGAVLLLVLQLVGIDQIGLLGLLLVLIAAAVAGGYATRAVATRLPPMGRGPRG